MIWTWNDNLSFINLQYHSKIWCQQLFFFFWFKEMYTFMQQGCIKLINFDNEDIIKICFLLLNFLFRKECWKKHCGCHIMVSTTVFNTDNIKCFLNINILNKWHYRMELWLLSIIINYILYLSHKKYINKIMYFWSNKCKNNKKILLASNIKQ